MSESGKTKVAYCSCHGGFSLSEAAIQRYAELKGLTLYPERGGFGFTTWWTVPADQRPIEPDPWHSAPLEERAAYNEAYTASVLSDRNFERTDPVLIRVIEELGAAANGAHADLQIAEVPSGARYRIDEYDGAESVMTPEDYAWQVAP